MGNVYVKQEDWENAVKFFDKSLAEHRNPDIVSLKNEVNLWLLFSSLLLPPPPASSFFLLVLPSLPPLSFSLFLFSLSQQVNKKWKEAQRVAYIDPKKSLEEKEKGNELFKKGEGGEGSEGGEGGI